MMTINTTPLPSGEDPQPKVLWILSGIKMWESFSFYGMRALLVLFMTKKLLYSDFKALTTYALYTAAIEAFSLLGGFLADKVLGLQSCIFAGCLLITLGHFSMMIFPETWFFLGLGLIIGGTGLFRGNSTTLLGLFYKDKDPRRDRGFTLYYTCMNIGAFLAVLACGAIGELYGWHYGFSLAAFGMLLGLLLQIRYRSLLEEKCLKVSSTLKARCLTWIGVSVAPFIFALSLYDAEKVYPFMPFIFVGSLGYLLKKVYECSLQEKKNVLRVTFAIIFLVIFFAIEEQIGSSFILFASRHVDTEFLGWKIPISSLIATNPLIIMVLGPVISLFSWVRSYEDGLKKMRLAFGLLMICFAYLLWLTQGVSQVGVLSFLLVYGGIAVSELFIGPTVWSICTALSPHHLKGSMMGLVTVGYALASFLGGYLSRLMAVPDHIAANVSFSIYRDGFQAIFCLLGIFLLLIVIIMRKTKSKYSDSLIKT